MRQLGVRQCQLEQKLGPQYREPCDIDRGRPQVHARVKLRECCRLGLCAQKVKQIRILPARARLQSDRESFAGNIEVGELKFGFQKG